ncbi:MAG TPA: hypothetical protein VGV67_04870, partial [Solirubrobacteraceae bacterium]|nr:hypothetical protein [Solirubrobacteraceae bacterium]
VLVAGYLAIGAARPASPGAAGLAAGTRLPPFAVVLATSDIACAGDDDPCDANVAREAGQGAAGGRPACEVRGPTVLNVCELAERGPLVLGIMATRQASCVGAFHRLEGLRRRHRGLQVAVVSVGGELDDLRQIVRGRRWSFPVGWDRDGVLASVYGVVTCPYVAVARWRGRVQATLTGAIGGDELARSVEAAVTASRDAGWRP